jgi:phosphate-selective porin OprO/OprP
MPVRAGNRIGRTPFRIALLAAAALAVGGAARSQEAAPPADDMKARIERLEAEVAALRALLRERATPPAPAAPAPAPTDTAKPSAPAPPAEATEPRPAEKPAAGADAKKADDTAKKDGQPKAPESLVVGDDLKFNVTWDPGGFRFRTADEAFSGHLGGRLMTDEVWWNQSPGLKKPGVQPAGSPLGFVTGVGPGVGELLDGFFVRRARFMGDGTVYQTIEFKTEFDFENYNNISFDESYVGARDLPYIDTVRVGQTHCPFGLEAYTSSRFLPMLERSPLFDAFYQEFAPGVFTDTTFLDQRVTTQHMFHRIDNFSQFNGASFGDGKYAYSGRVSALPVYEDDGRCLLHLGVAYQWRKGSPPLDFNGGTPLPSNPNPNVTENTDLVRFRVRPTLRDAVGLQGNGARVVDTGNLIAAHVQSVNAELLGYWGPLWVQSEACLAHVTDAFFPASAGATGRGDLNYYGAYVQVGYFLTGDNRGYDKRFGKYDRVRPLENFFLVRDEHGRAQYGLGAWELLYRFGYVNLNDDFVRGGTYGEHTVGLNWYWNPNIKFQFNYINGQRTVPAGAVSGNIQGFALRGALEF